MSPVERVSVLDVPHRELAGLLAGGAPVYLPINPVEYHGPHLSLHNDHAVSVGLGARLHARLGDLTGGGPMLLASSIEAGVEPCPGPGTRPTDYATLRGLTLAAVDGLLSMGARRVVLLTFHGAPLHAWALEAGVARVRSRGGQALQPLNLVLRALLERDTAGLAEAFDGIADPAERARMRDGLADDFHAGFFETSLALSLAPETVSPAHTQLRPCPEISRDRALSAASRAARRMGREELARELAFAAAGVGWMSLGPFPGYTGSPHRASAAAGEVFSRAIEARYEAATRAVFSGGAPPAPIMRWIVAATAGGRIPTSSVPLRAVATPASVGL